MSTLDNSILVELKKTTTNVLKRREQERILDQQKTEEKKDDEIKKEAERIYNEMMTEEKLLATAQRGVNVYPILLIVSGKNYIFNRPTKNKKTSYQYTIGEVGQYVFEKLVENGFTPVMVRVDDNRIENKHNSPHWYKDFNDEITEPGYYLGIEWSGDNHNRRYY